MPLCASDSARLNSRSPFPTALPASGNRLAPKTSNTISIRIRISLPLRFPRPIPWSLTLLVQPLRRTTGGRAAAGRRERGIRRRRVLRLLGLQGALEFLDALPDGRADLRDALGTEEQHQDEQQDRDFREAEIRKHWFAFLEERAGDEIRDHHADHCKERHIKPDVPERHRHHQQIHVDRPDRGRNRPREHFLGRSLRQEAPQERVQQPAQHETYGQDAKIEEGGGRTGRDGGWLLPSTPYAVLTWSASRAGEAGSTSSSASACCARSSARCRAVSSPPAPSTNRITSATKL